MHALDALLIGGPTRESVNARRWPLESLPAASARRCVARLVAAMLVVAIAVAALDAAHGQPAGPALFALQQ